MHIFYTPEIETSKELPEEESQHCVRVLRLKEGDEIHLTDGKGAFYKAVITLSHPKHCKVDITETIYYTNPWPGKICIAIAPTKNIDRTEWFAEKCTEIGIDEIILLKCRFSERKEVKNERITKILVSAMKQSLKAVLPVLSGMTEFKKLVAQPFDGEKFIAHCYDDENKIPLKKAYTPGRNALVLIGPEGDFSTEEVEIAVKNGFKPISLGNSRLRTETAGVVACHTLQLINER
ncbi:16S rRNA (uracil(1498)-N(3))-methyltransferase [Coprobacter tertius]|uniref:Ribosomal RNA small subunit methyltransferase E n=1 Tax=Coprobacter tertius TaxID=2944915 RepID=A0ABT1MH98_9BACT|nr:16S rRNA (uracil(1498)-N(3))-methyltransferase [Coprobacter tertius]MCP9611990.1 16S rRNA (uracil(1498)-N(3))-methyltransferase [Coprobacter tertius]